MRTVHQGENHLADGASPVSGNRTAARTRRQKGASPAVSSAKEALLEEKRQEILDVARHLFHEHGYAGTTTEMIAEAIGASKPYVYYYFRNKQKIFETLCWEPSEACLTTMNFAPDDTRPAHEKLAAGLEGLLDQTIRHYPASFFSYLYPQGHSPDFRRAIRKLGRDFYDRMCELLEEAKREGKVDFDDAKITALAACSIPGFLFNWYRPDGQLSPEAMNEQLLPLMYRVIGLKRTG